MNVPLSADEQEGTLRVAGGFGEPGPRYHYLRNYPSAILDITHCGLPPENARDLK
jgi:hypothetical protein